MTALALSVLDLLPVRSDQSSADAIEATRSLARRADQLGFHRYWIAEHHNMPAIAASSPPVLIAILAAATESIRLGSGGVMLPNHSPLVVAEQFAALEAAFPGRIDLGVGRAPGSDPVITALLRSSGTTSDVEQFPRHIHDILALLRTDGAVLRVGSTEYELRATPRATSVPDVWLLGSSDYSARLAASLGLPYVFAHHFSGAGTERALELYRTEFRASEHLDAPRTFLSVNAVVAETEGEARALALPQLVQMARLRTGMPLGPQLLVEEAEEFELTPAMQSHVDEMTPKWVVGEPDAAARTVRELAARFAVDEVMLVPVASERSGVTASASPSRERTLELLSAALA